MCICRFTGLTAMRRIDFKLLDAFYDAGGNFIDTANNYQDKTSEAFISEWMESRGVREHMIIATKLEDLRIETPHSLEGRYSGSGSY